MKKTKVLSSEISPIFSFFFIISLIILAGTILKAENDPEVTNYFSQSPKVIKLSSTSINVSWNHFPYSNETTNYQVIIGTTYYGHSIKQINEICKYLVPGREIDVKVVVYHDNKFCGISSATKILMPPATPSTIHVSDIASNSFSVAWNSVESATSYNLYDGMNKIASKVESDTDNRIDLYDLPEGKLFNLSMTSVNAGGESPKSQVIPVQLLPVASMTMHIPNSSITSDSFLVKWTKQEYADGYEILINDSSIAKVDKDTLEYEVTGLDAGTTVSVKVAIVNKAGSASPTEGIIVQLKPDAPILTATDISSYSCTLTWTVANGANNYKIFENGDNAIYNVPSTITNVTLTSGIIPGKTYYYKVRGVNDIGESVDSNIVEVTYIKDDQSEPSTEPPNENPTVSASAPILLNRGLSPSIKIPNPRISGKLLGKNIVLVYFPEELKGPELALEIDYLEMLASTREMTDVKFIGIVINNEVTTDNKIENLRWVKSESNNNIVIPGKIPVVRFYNEKGKLVEQIRISLPIMTVNDIYKALPEAIEKEQDSIHLYHE